MAKPSRPPLSALIRRFSAPGAKGGGGGGRLWKFAGAALGGLAAGAGAAHLLYSQGHKVGVELRAPRPEPLPPKDPTPEDYDA